MARQYGMRFQWIDPPYWMLLLDLGFDDLISEVHNKFIKQFLIHPDSLHLLEPQKDDVCMYFDAMHQWYGAWNNVENGDAEGMVIVQRNGISFMWPEKSAA